MYIIEWKNKDGEKRNIKVSTIRACRDVVRALASDYRNTDVVFSYTTRRRIREIVIVVGN